MLALPWEMGTSWPDSGRQLKNSDFFTGIQWRLFHILLINASIISDIALSEELVLLREGWDTFISTHHSLQVTTVAAQHYSK